MVALRPGNHPHGFSGRLLVAQPHHRTLNDSTFIQVDPFNELLREHQLPADGADPPLGEFRERDCSTGVRLGRCDVGLGDSYLGQLEAASKGEQ